MYLTLLGAAKVNVVALSIIPVVALLIVTLVDVKLTITVLAGILALPVTT